MKKSYGVRFGVFLLCGLVLVGCSSTDTTKLEERIDIISNEVKDLTSQIDDLESIIADKDSGKSTSKSKDSSEDSSEDSSDDTEESTTESTKKEKTADSSGDLIKATAEDDSLKVTVTDVKFLGNTISSKEDSEILAVIYYTVENVGSEKVTPSDKVPYFLEVTEEDDVSEDTLYQDYVLDYYPDLKDLYDNGRLSIKPGAKVEAAVEYAISSKDKDVNITLKATGEFTMDDVDVVASKTYTSDEIAKDIKANEKIKPEF